MKSLKKVFSTFVSLTTILWSVGGTLAFPGVAMAATIASGDLIKASGPAVYYYAADGKRYVFPNEKTYFTWYSGFGTVKTITDSELAAITIGGNVTYRPGVKMVKITTDPKVYAVARGGVLRHVPTEACAVTLYGASWNTMIEDVSDGFFVNYTVGAAINSACSDFDKVAEMNASPTINADLGVSTPVGGSVSASLASDTPAGVTLPKNAASVSLFKVNLTAGSAAGLITGLRVRHIGVGATADFSNVYLYDANGNRLTTGRTINSSSQVVEFNGLSLTVPANSTLAVVVVGDLSSPSTTGGQHAFEISDAAGVVITGGTVGGSFPVRGNTFTVGTQTAGELDVNKGTTPANPTVGAAEAEVSNFKLTANTNDIEVRRITLRQDGDIANEDISDFKLYQGTTLVASTPSVVNGKIVLNFSPAYVIEDGQTKTFILRAKVSGRASRTVVTYVEYPTDVYAIDRLYNTGAAVDLDDSPAFDSTNSMTVTTQGGQLTVAFNGPATSNVAKGSQDVKLYKFALTSSDSNIEVRRLRFIIESADGQGGLLEEGTTDYFTDLKVIDTDSGSIVSGPISLPATATSGTGLTFTDSVFINAGQTRNLAFTADLRNDTDTNFVDKGFRVCLSDNFDADAAGASLLCGDTAGDAIFQLGDIKVVETSENLALAKIVPNDPITGNTLTVRSGTLSVALASTPSATTFVKKQANISAVGFAFTAGTESSAKVTALVLTGTGDVAVAGTYATADLNDVVTSCSLYDGATQVGTAQSPDGTAGTMTFSSLNWTVDAGTTKTLVAKCTADSLVDGTEDHFALGIAATNVTAEDKDGNEITESLSTGVTANAATSGQQIIQTVKSGGTLTITAGSQPQATIVVGGAAKKFAEFTATAQFEDITIEKIMTTSTGQAANFSSVLVRVAGADKGTAVLPSGASTFENITLTSPITIVKDTAVTFELWGTVAPITSSSTANGATTGVARSGATAALGIGAGETATPWDSNFSSRFNVMAIGSASGDRVYASGSDTSGNSMTLRKTKPVITKQTPSSATLSPSEMDLYKFQIGADAAGEVRWKQVSFTVTTSTNVTSLANFKLYKNNVALTSSEVQIFNGTTGAELSSANLGGSDTVVVRLVNEEVVSGAGTLYALRATPTFTSTGNSITTSFTRSTTAGTGYLTAAAGTVTISLDANSVSFDGTGELTSRFVWSDVSEPVHGFATGTGSSRDWTNDLNLEDMSQSQVLSN
jgi:hypothetical protein